MPVPPLYWQIYQSIMLNLMQAQILTSQNVVFIYSVTKWGQHYYLRLRQQFSQSFHSKLINVQTPITI